MDEILSELKKTACWNRLYPAEQRDLEFFVKQVWGQGIKEALNALPEAEDTSAAIDDALYTRSSMIAKWNSYRAEAIKRITALLDNK